MGESLRKYFTRWLRVLLVGGLILQGSSMPWQDSSAYAANSDSIVIGVFPVSNKPPGDITDLVASANLAVEGQISLSWTAPQGNAGGQPIPNQTVAGYVIHYATFSVDSLAGNTTSWWNATAGNSVVLQPPQYNPKSPGQLEAYAFSGLTPGAVFYFGVKSISQGGITSAIDDKSATPGQQANALSTKFSSSPGTPRRPNGLNTSLNGSRFTVSWHAVTQDTNGNPITIDHYEIDRYDAIGSSANFTTNVQVPNTAFTDTVGVSVFYYRIMAVTATDVMSAPSDYLDSSPNLNRYALAEGDPSSRVVMPEILARELNTEITGLNEDLEVIPIRQPQQENATTLKAYLFQVQKANSGQSVLNFAFSQPLAQVQVSYSISSSVLGLSSAVRTPLANSNAQAQAIAQLIALYWFNGSAYVRLGTTVLLDTQALLVNARNMGDYQIQAVGASTQFGFANGSPYPRVITPNDPSQNNRVFFFFNNPTGEQIQGSIYDLRGAKVRDLKVNSQSPTQDSLVWDGHDNNGAVVRSGIYLYKVTAGNQSLTGTLVVAR